MITATLASVRSPAPISSTAVSRRERTEVTTSEDGAAARIARGRALLADPNYPSREIIGEVAKAFLASESANDNAPLWRSQA